MGVIFSKGDLFYGGGKHRHTSDQSKYDIAKYVCLQEKTEGSCSEDITTPKDTTLAELDTTTPEDTTITELEARNMELGNE